MAELDRHPTGGERVAGKRERVAIVPGCIGVGDGDSATTARRNGDAGAVVGFREAVLDPLVKVIFDMVSGKLPVLVTFVVSVEPRVTDEAERSSIDQQLVTVLFKSET